MSSPSESRKNNKETPGLSESRIVDTVLLVVMVVDDPVESTVDIVNVVCEFVELIISTEGAIVLGVRGVLVRVTSRLVLADNVGLEFETDIKVASVDPCVFVPSVFEIGD